MAVKLANVPSFPTQNIALNERLLNWQTREQRLRELLIWRYRDLARIRPDVAP